MTSYTQEQLLAQEFEDANKGVLGGLLRIGVYILGATSKVGKSMVATALANAVANGSEYLGKPNTKSKVLYFDNDNYAFETKGRVEVNLFITGITKELLDKWLSIRKNKQGNNTIFTSINGGKVGKKEYNECLKQRCKIAGIDKHLTAHCFRYACNNILLSNKIDVNDIKIMLGWKINKTEMLFHAYYDNLFQEKKFIEYSKMLNEIIYKSV